jgi:hypothetical protein
MSESDDFSQLEDAEFFAERRRVMAMIAALADRYKAMNAEFEKRAQRAWAGGER